MHSTKSNFNSTRTYFQNRISKRGSVLKVRGGAVATITLCSKIVQIDSANISKLPTTIYRLILLYFHLKDKKKMYYTDIRYHTKKYHVLLWGNFPDIHSYTKVNFSALLQECNLIGVKPSLSVKSLSINNFTTKILSKLLSDLYIGVHLKGAKKFGSKVINRQLFHWFTRI